MKQFDQKRLDKIKAQYAQTRPNLTLELITEIERLQADSRALAALREAAQVVIRRIDDGTTRELGTVVSSDPMFAVILSQSEIDALRAALAEGEAA